MDWIDDSPGNVNFVRQTCLLSEAVFTALLGGYRRRRSVNSARRTACAYGHPDIVFPWEGACSHSALSESKRVLGKDTMVNMSAEDLALSWAEARRKAKEATANYHREYHQKRRAAMGFKKAREKARLAMYKWREENKDEDC